MTKDKYASIRRDSNFLFRYYLEEGGYVKNPNTFKNYLTKWLRSKGLIYDLGIQIIKQNLDKKHQYVK